MADVCVKATVTLLLLSSTISQDSWLDYWLSQCLLHCSLTEPLPLQRPVACRLLLKSACSSPACQSWPDLDVPFLLPSSFPFHPPSLIQHWPFSTSSILVDLSKLKTVMGVERRKHREVQDLSLSAIWVIIFIVQPWSLWPVFWWNGALCGCCCTVQEQTFSSHVCLWNAHSVCHTGKMECYALSGHSFPVIE